MSTKIYDAYEMRNVSVQKMGDFLQALRKECIARHTEKTKRNIANLCAEIIDICTLYKTERELWNILYNDMDKVLTNWYANSRSSVPRVLAQGKFQPTIEEVRQGLSAPYSVSRVARDIVDYEISLSQIDGVYSKSTYQCNERIVFFPLSSKRCLLMAFGNEMRQLMNNISRACQGEEWFGFKSEYCIEDYHYQNQTDQPDSISSTKWNKRRRDWNKVMPSGVPSTDGYVINICDKYSILNAIYFTDDDELMGYFPSFETRLNRWAYNCAICDDENVSICSIMQRSEELNNKTGKLYEKMQAYTQRLESILLHIDSKCLDASIISYL